MRQLTDARSALHRENAGLRDRIARFTEFCDRITHPEDLGFAVSFEVRQLAHELKAP
jgi:hypothetical protein